MKNATGLTLKTIKGDSNYSHYYHNMPERMKKWCKMAQSGGQHRKKCFCKLSKVTQPLILLAHDMPKTTKHDAHIKLA